MGLGDGQNGRRTRRVDFRCSSAGNGGFAATDSSAANDATFEFLAIDIVIGAARDMATYGEIMQRAYAAPDFTRRGRSRPRTLHGTPFPINPMNVLADRHMLQADTGPVLFAKHLGGRYPLQEMVPSFAGRFAAHPGTPCVRSHECEVKVLARGGAAQ